LRGLSSSAEKSCAEEIEFRAAVHLAFDELELGDLAFGLSVGPGFEECGGDCAFVGVKPIREGSDRTTRVP
jgi:hypothetical protein